MKFHSGTVKCPDEWADSNPPKPCKSSLARKLPLPLTFLGSGRFLPGFAVLLVGDLGEGEEAEEEAGSAESHVGAVRSERSCRGSALHSRPDTGWSQEWLSQKA